MFSATANNVHGTPQALLCWLTFCTNTHTLAFLAMTVGKQRCMCKLAKFAHKCYKVTASCVYLCVCVCVCTAGVRAICSTLYFVHFTVVFVVLQQLLSRSFIWQHMFLRQQAGILGMFRSHTDLRKLTHHMYTYIHTSGLYMHTCTFETNNIYVHTLDCVVASIVGCARFRRLSACLSAVPTLVSWRKHLVVVYFSICKLICCFNVFFIAAFT